MHPFETKVEDHCESPLEAFEDIAPILERLAKDSLLRRHLGEKSRERYMQLFSRSIWSKDLLALSKT